MGDDPLEGFDCSGFAIEFMKSFGALANNHPDMTAHELFGFLTGRPPAQITGAMAFFGSPEKIIHVTILYNSELMFEFGGGGSSTINLAAAVSQNAYGRIRPIRNRPGLVGVRMPDYI